MRDVVLSEFRRRRVVAIARDETYSDPVGLAAALMDAGITAMEFTFTGVGAAEAIRQVKAALPTMLIGGGTVLEPHQLERTIDAGADFAVSPILNPALVHVAAGRIPMIPGACTPSEVAAAVALGCPVVKLYPARLGGPAYVRDLLSVFPDAALLPTGGIALADVGAYLSAGAVAVGLGSSLVPKGAGPAEVEACARSLTTGLGWPSLQGQGFGP